MKLIILDRDGVINHDSSACIKSAEEWRAIRGSVEAIARLCKAGFRVAVASNQSGIGRGLFDLPALTAVNAKMHKAVLLAGGRLDAVFFCPHTEQEHCNCRKPRPGMIEDILRRFQAEPNEVTMVGDSLRDLQAASAMRCKPVLVLTGKGRKTLKAGGLPAESVVRVDLAAVAAELAP
ncbi:MAG: D-glycero-beta-D-manno-heptose 1,7-bisphosphate 7-phosphatase [Burkholderiaceae bacterium]|nr:D-glycero-beta-D-manno-heptose 1,7-bisphosphate 7-phosphatase [Burkholderiaceae bacterium]